jgi:hypothetical protein
MNHKFNPHNPTSILSLIVKALTFASLAATAGIVRPAYASTLTSVHDLAIELVFAPERAKACDTFTVSYTITNYGPDPATDVYVGFNVPDPLEVKNIMGSPVNLATGQRATVTAIIKVVAFVPTESRRWWITASVSPGEYPDSGIDPLTANNTVTSSIRLIGRRMVTCP